MQRIAIGLALALALTLIGGSRLVAQSDEADRIKEAARVFDEIMAAPDKATPKSILMKAAGIAVFPGTLKGGLLVGGHWGRGLISSRAKDGTWSSPAFLTLTGGSIGAQIGGQAVDLLLVIMNEKGLETLVGNEFKIGADASAAAGPVGRDAEASTDIQMRAQILSYSRTRGLFAGVTLKGSVIKQDRDANERFYGQYYKTRDILFDNKGDAKDPVPAWKTTLAKYAN